MLIKLSGEAVVKSIAAKTYFNRQTERWDRHARHDSQKLRAIMRVLDLHSGQRVLDVACGKGELFAWLLSRDPALLMGIDISETKTQEARARFQDRRLRILTADYYHVAAGSFDRIIVYNAYPHFTDREKFVQKTLDLLLPGGRFVIAHNTGRESVNAMNEALGGHVAPLEPAETECGWFEPFFDIDTCTDKESIYMISGLKR